MVFEYPKANDPRATKATMRMLYALRFFSTIFANPGARTRGVIVERTGKKNGNETEISNLHTLATPDI